MSSEGNFVTFGPEANCTLKLCSIEDSVYGYRPSLAANTILAVLFSLLTVVHVYLGLRWKTRWFMWCLVLSCIHEVTGYIARLLLYQNPWSFGAFIVQIICITQAPVFYCAAIYVTLEQSINHYAPRLTRFPAKMFRWVFVPCDIISLVLQGTGGGLSASSSGSSQVGVDIAMAGLIFQVVTLIILTVLLCDFLFRFLRSQEARRLAFKDNLFFVFLTVAVFTTLVRCIYRADELKQGYSGKSIRQQGLFIGLEGVLIAIAISCLCVGHPGLVFRKKPQKYATVVGADDAGASGILLNSQKTAYRDDSNF